ncbi:MAG TPA: hypothetical protein VLC92_10700 [Rhodocyclaceae bacterium]|nr:hypothetical protein [Rhodocyclaceae bacterium]
MTDNELAEEFIKVLSKNEARALRASIPMLPPAPLPEEDRDSAEVLVRVISWGGRPHTPVGAWIKVAATPAAIRKEIRRVLKLKTYFKVCRVCGEKNPTGWMDGNTCHQCLEKSGVVF